MHCCFWTWQKIGFGFVEGFLFYERWVFPLDREAAQQCIKPPFSSFSPSEFYSTSPAVSYPRLPRDGWQCPQTIFLFLLSFLLKPWPRGALLSLEEALDFHPILSSHHAVTKFCVSVQIAGWKQVFGGKRGHMFLRKSLIEKEEPRF